MTDLERRLELLGLAQYYNVFLQEGFDTWDTLADITESDLNFLEVKLGHRRKLQRAIAGSRGNPDSRGNSVPLPISLQNHSSTDTYYNTDESAGEQRQRQPASSVASASGINTKRKYRRHPKADEHAPERPPSAYVIFSNMVRERLKDENLSFTEIAKKVGEMWQVLDPQERERCEHQAAEAKRDYKEKMEEYKKTAEYEAYQRYLEEFKRKHGLPQKGQL
ncbi:HMG-box, partial [Sporormia fimetaria CBS 119925]